MTKRQEKLNIQVAEAMGWEGVKKSDDPYDDSSTLIGKPSQKRVMVYEILPDFLGLNHFFNARGGVIKKIERMGYHWEYSVYGVSRWFRMGKQSHAACIADGSITEAGCKAFVEMMKNE